MTQKEFQAVFREQVRQCEGLLIQKAKEYTGDSTPQRALAGMMAKHIISIYDMCFTDRKTFELAVWEEKITDSLNYLFLLKAVIKEELEHQPD